MSENEKWATLAGGTELDLVLADGESRRLVRVRKLPLRQLGRLGEAMNDLVSEAALYSGLSADEVDALHPDAALELVREGRRLNAKSFGAFVALQKEKAAMMGIDLDKIVQDAVARQSPSSKSSSS